MVAAAEGGPRSLRWLAKQIALANNRREQRIARPERSEGHAQIFSLICLAITQFLELIDSAGGRECELRITRPAPLARGAPKLSSWTTLVSLLLHWLLSGQPQCVLGQFFAVRYLSN